MTTKQNLFISEKFTSIQGEGRTMGCRSIFVRLSGCNILCQSDSWICDTIEVWKKGTKTNFDEVFTENELLALKDGTHLVITGGEPLMHQKKLVEFFQWFANTYNFLPIIEIETNCTIIPNDYLCQIVNYFNVSPKLSNSGEKIQKRYKPEVWKFFNNLSSSIFKFVIANTEDWVELTNLTIENRIHKFKIWVMPAGSSQEELINTRLFVAQLSISQNVNFSDRLHISLWNQKTGV